MKPFLTTTKNTKDYNGNFQIERLHLDEMSASLSVSGVAADVANAVVDASILL